MGRIISVFRNLVQVKILIKNLFSRYRRIITNLFKLIWNSFKLICLSVNYLAALILIPAIVFYFTHLISRDFIIPILVSLLAIIIYVIIMSNYFSKGIHKFGQSSRDIKQQYHTVKMEHKLVMKSLKDDAASGRFFLMSSLVIVLEFILFFFLFNRFNIPSRFKVIILFFVMVQIIFLLGEYTVSGYGIFSLPRLHYKKLSASSKKEVEKDNVPLNYVKSDNFDELIIDVEPEDGDVKIRKIEDESEEE